MFSADLGVNQSSGPPPPPATNDPPFQKVALLLHGDGTNGAQNNTFVDSSSNAFSITRTGNVAQGTFSPFSLAEGQWSNYFDGTGDYLSANLSSLSYTGDFTIECLVYPTASSLNMAIVDARDTAGTGGGWDIYINTSTNVVTCNFATVNLASNTSISINNWIHIACVRSGSTIKMYINGVEQIATISTSSTINNPLFSIGQKTFGSSTLVNFNGYISNFRIVNGTAIYTSNFTPSTTPLTAVSGTSLLTCQSNRFKDNSSNNFTITRNGDTKVTAFSPFAPSAAYSASTNGGSGYWDGTTNAYLSTGSSSSLNAGSGDFTVEAFVYYYGTLSGKYNSICAIPNFSTGLMWRNTSGTSVAFYIAGSACTWTVSLTQGQWYHFAITRQSGTVKLYINGVAQATTYSNTTNVTPNGAAYVGTDAGGGVGYQYISNFRYVVGTAVYTANFTPPTAPLTAITNTQLLLNCTNAGIIDNAGKNDIETVGNAQISTSVKKYGTGSMYFDGTGDYLVLPQSIELNLTGDFTIEFWVYFNAISGDITLIAKTGSGGQYGWFVQLVSNNLRVNIGNNGSLGTSKTFAWTPSTSTWYHVAVTRSGTSLRSFINGTQIGTTATESNNGTSTASVGVGINLDGTYQALNGYIDDLRITKGQALYTSNFTPPTQAFPNQ